MHHRLVTLSLSLALAACGAPDAPSAGDAERGRRLMAQYHCGSCHRVPGVEAARGDLAVTLEAFGRRSYIAGQLPNRRDLLERWIVDPPALLPGATMPAMGVSAADARDIAAYLESLE